MTTVDTVVKEEGTMVMEVDVMDVDTKTADTTIIDGETQ